MRNTLSDFEFRALDLLSNGPLHPARFAQRIWGLYRCVPGPNYHSPEQVASAHLTRLERKGLVKYKKDQHKRRLWSITERGAILLVNELTLQLEVADDRRILSGQQRRLVLAPA